MWTLEDDGLVRLDRGDEPFSIVEDGAAIVAADHEIHGLVSALTDGGSVVIGTVKFRDLWTGDERTTSARWRSSADPLDLPTETNWVGVTANADSDGAWWRRRGPTTDTLPWRAGTPMTRNGRADREISVAGGVSSAAVSEDLASLAVVDDRGGLHLFDLSGLNPAEIEARPDYTTTARFLIGGGTLVVGGRDGTVAVMLQVPRVRIENRGATSLRVAGISIESGASAELPDNQLGQSLASRPEIELTPAAPVWRTIRQMPPMPSAASWIAPAHRRRGLVVGGEDGSVGLYYSTSGRRLLLDNWSGDPIRFAALSPKGDGAVVLAGDQMLDRSIDNPHPEISFRTLFLPVWYEGYAAPKWVWQTTGGTDAFEPKMSLWPLIFGTLKATLYALLFSVPIALMAAVYVSQLAPAWLQSIVKPTIELMAAVPSVVVGFIAALWLAPRLEAALFAALVTLICLPLSVFVALLAWRVLPVAFRRSAGAGSELVALLVGLFSVLILVAVFADPIESWLFGGDFQRFLFTEWGLRFDQRNSIIVGLALGFAVIPVIFTIAEDACSAVPGSLVSASRALGATRWQTAVKLVVPAASPGLFAGVMLGLGRAVGETMIVLMAAGNTPILDLSPFNGMRTMSAAIAVEIPEAPVGGTLFRVLFLTGALLFVFTLVVTTAADVVGGYLRKKYARF